MARRRPFVNLGNTARLRYSDVPKHIIRFARSETCARGNNIRTMHEKLDDSRLRGPSWEASSCRKGTQPYRMSGEEGVR